MERCTLDDKKARTIIRLLRQGFGTDDIVAQGVCTKNEVQEVVSFLREHNLLGRIIGKEIK